MGPIHNPRWEQKRTEGYVIVSTILYGIVICYTETKCSCLNEQFNIAILSVIGERNLGRFAPNPIRPVSRFAPIPVCPGRFVPIPFHPRSFRPHLLIVL